jgi:membrane protease YdiL (CAAX protease family)
MNGTPYYPYNQYNTPPEYAEAIVEKKTLRRTANRLCWTLLFALLLMSSFGALICPLFLKAIGYTGDYSVEGFNGYTPVLYYLASGMGYVAGMAVPVLLYFAFRRISLRETLPFEKTGVLKTAACVFFGLAVCMLGNIPANAVANIQKTFGFSGEIPQSPLTNDLPVLILYGITVAIIPAIVEELFFRGMVLQSLRRFGDGFAIVASAVLFGLFHGNFVQFVFALIAGLVMAQVVIRTGSLWTSILIHFLNNGISYTVQVTSRFVGEEQANQIYSYVVMAIFALGLISIFYLLIKDKHFFRGDKHNPYFKFSSKIFAFFVNPGGIAMLLFSLVSSIYILYRF